MRINLDILILDHSTFTFTLLSLLVLHYIQMSITAVCVFHKNGFVDGKSGKLMSQPQNVTLAHSYAPVFLCVQDTKSVNK